MKISYKVSCTLLCSGVCLYNLQRVLFLVQENRFIKIVSKFIPLSIMVIAKNNNSRDNVKDVHKIKHEDVAAI
jgi:hypothetical protein